jgi:SAM-dependent methyltransferase
MVIPQDTAIVVPPDWEEKDGIFRHPNPREASEYPEALRPWLAKIEPEHFWFNSRANLISRAVCTWVPEGGWLELGCGTGFVLRAVGRSYQGPTFGQDVASYALEIARGRTSAPLFLCPLDEVPLRELGGIGLFDVIEHLRDDVSAMAAAGRYLRRGGVLLVTVPAHRWLWSRADEAMGHQRRYGRKAILSRLASSGFRPESCRPFFGSLLPGLLLRRTTRLRDPELILRAFLRPPARPLNLLMRGITECEGALCLRGLAPFGTSWLAVGRKM